MKNKGKVIPFDSDKASSAIIGGAGSIVDGHGPNITAGEDGVLYELSTGGGESLIETNDRGGKQSKIKGRMTEVPPLALIEVSAVMGLGASNYPRSEDGVPNWYNISCAENIDHAMEHVANYLVLRNDMTGQFCSLEDMREELSHATARMMMAMEQFIREEV
jgi:hypothetical protein